MTTTAAETKLTLADLPPSMRATVRGWLEVAGPPKSEWAGWPPGAARIYNADPNGHKFDWSKAGTFSVIRPNGAREVFPRAEVEAWANALPLEEVPAGMLAPLRAWLVGEKAPTGSLEERSALIAQGWRSSSVPGEGGLNWHESTGAVFTAPDGRKARFTRAQILGLPAAALLTIAEVPVALAETVRLWLENPNEPAVSLGAGRRKATDAGWSYRSNVGGYYLGHETKAITFTAPDKRELTLTRAEVLALPKPPLAKEEVHPEVVKWLRRLLLDSRQEWDSTAFGKWDGAASTGGRGTIGKDELADSAWIKSPDGRYREFTAATLREWLGEPAAKPAITLAEVPRDVRAWLEQCLANGQRDNFDGKFEGWDMCFAGPGLGVPFRASVHRPGGDQLDFTTPESLAAFLEVPVPAKKIELAEIPADLATWMRKLLKSDAPGGAPNPAGWGAGLDKVYDTLSDTTTRTYYLTPPGRKRVNYTESKLRALLGEEPAAKAAAKAVEPAKRAFELRDLPPAIRDWMRMNRNLPPLEGGSLVRVEWSLESSTGSGEAVVFTVRRNFDGARENFTLAELKAFVPAAPAPKRPFELAEVPTPIVEWARWGLAAGSAPDWALVNAKKTTGWTCAEIKHSDGSVILRGPKGDAEFNVAELCAWQKPAIEISEVPWSIVEWARSMYNLPCRSDWYKHHDESAWSGSWSDGVARVLRRSDNATRAFTKAEVEAAPRHVQQPFELSDAPPAIIAWARGSFGLTQPYHGYDYKGWDARHKVGEEAVKIIPAGKLREEDCRTFTKAEIASHMEAEKAVSIAAETVKKHIEQQVDKAIASGFLAAAPAVKLIATQEEAEALYGKGSFAGTATQEKKHMANETVMPTKTQKIVQTMKVDGTDAAMRVAGKQFVKLARDPLAALLRRHLAPGDESMRAKIGMFLET